MYASYRYIIYIDVYRICKCTFLLNLYYIYIITKIHTNFTFLNIQTVVKHHAIVDFFSSVFCALLLDFSTSEFCASFPEVAALRF